MDFDYYQIKGKWNAATLNRRAEKLEEAQKKIILDVDLLK